MLELTIALALGVLAAHASARLYLSQRSAYLADAERQSLADAAAIALELLTRQVRMAGFAPFGVPRPAGVFGCAGGYPAGPAPMPSCLPLPSGSDGLLVRYVGDLVSTWPTLDGEASDCLGQGLGAAQAPVANRFYARPSPLDGRPELVCEGNGRSGIPQAVVEGVERLRLRYWWRGAWVDASWVDAWQRVSAVEICVQLAGVRPPGHAAAPGGGLALDCDGRPFKEASGQIRTAYRRIVALRNPGG